MSFSNDDTGKGRETQGFESSQEFPSCIKNQIEVHRFDVCRLFNSVRRLSVSNGRNTSRFRWVRLLRCNFTNNGYCFKLNIYGCIAINKQLTIFLCSGFLIVLNLEPLLSRVNLALTTLRQKERQCYFIKI